MVLSHPHTERSPSPRLLLHLLLLVYSISSSTPSPRLLLHLLLYSSISSSTPPPLRLPLSSTPRLLDSLPPPPNLYFKLWIPSIPPRLFFRRESILVKCLSGIQLGNRESVLVSITMLTDLKGLSFSSSVKGSRSKYPSTPSLS